MSYLSVSRVHAGIAAIFVASAAFAACYSGQIDPNSSGLFVCESNEDCAFNPDFKCISGLCVEDFGPVVSIVTPTVAQVFASGLAEYSLTLKATNLTLVAPSTDATPGRGYLEIFLDDVRLTQVISGDIANGLKIVAPNEWNPAGGLHHIGVQAFLPNGVAYSNSEARARSSFWIDDGKPHVGILSPGPLTTFKPASALEVKIGAINFGFVKSGTAPSTDPSLPTGHVHVFLGSLIPDCLGAANSCKDDYRALAEPSSITPVFEMTAPSLVIPADILLNNTRLSIVAQSSDHQAFPNSNPNEVVYDAIPLHIDRGPMQ